LTHRINQAIEPGNEVRIAPEEMYRSGGDVLVVGDLGLAEVREEGE
jgi:hypothetical protein